MSDEETNSTIANLARQINDQANAIATMRAQLAHFESPFREVFLAKLSGTKQWQERKISGGTVGDFTGGRKCTSDTDPPALIDLAGDSVLLEVRDGNNMRYVQIAGAGTLRFVISGNETGGGYYKGRSVKGKFVAAPGANLNMVSSGVTINATDDLLVVNLYENTRSSHALLTADSLRWFHGLTFGEKHTDDRTIVFVLGVGISECVV